MDEHPRLTKEGVYAALAFASEALLADVVYPTNVERKVEAQTSEGHCRIF